MKLCRYFCNVGSWSSFIFVKSLRLEDCIWWVLSEADIHLTEKANGVDNYDIPSGLLFDHDPEMWHKLNPRPMIL